MVLGHCLVRLVDVGRKLAENLAGIKGGSLGRCGIGHANLGFGVVANGAW